MIIQGEKAWEWFMKQKDVIRKPFFREEWLTNHIFFGKVSIGSKFYWMYFDIDNVNRCFITNEKKQLLALMI